MAVRRPRELFRRSPWNPILVADEWPYPVNTVFNPAAARVGDETVLLVRVETLSGVSQLSVARSRDGETNWRIDPEPLLAPTPDTDGEQWGFEDARIVWIEDLDRYAITCTSYGPAGPAVYLALSEDFRTVERRGIVLPPDDKNACLLQERVGGKWLLFHRPKTVGSESGSIYCSSSDDLEHWREPRLVMGPREGAYWDGYRIGLGAPPLKTEYGWLFVYHGVKHTVAGDIYRAGLALSALDAPWRLLRRCDEWAFGPCEPYERTGDVPNVVFPCGLVHEAESGLVHLYYGAADTCIGLASAPLESLLDAVLAAPAA